LSSSFTRSEGAVLDIGWYFFSGVPLLTSCLLIAFRTAQTGLKPHEERNLKLDWMR
jgi:hypothetical protein